MVYILVYELKYICSTTVRVRLCTRHHKLFSQSTTVIKAGMNHLSSVYLLIRRIS